MGQDVSKVNWEVAVLIPSFSTVKLAVWLSGDLNIFMPGQSESESYGMYGSVAVKVGRYAHFLLSSSKMFNGQVILHRLAGSKTCCLITNDSCTISLNIFYYNSLGVMGVPFPKCPWPFKVISQCFKGVVWMWPRCYSVCCFLTQFCLSPRLFQTHFPFKEMNNKTSLYFAAGIWLGLRTRILAKVIGCLNWQEAIMTHKPKCVALSKHVCIFRPQEGRPVTLCQRLFNTL